MIDEYNKATIKAKQGKDVTFEVNFNDDIKVVKIGVDGNSSVIALDDLVHCLIMYGSQENINDLIPVKKINVKKYETILEFRWKASRNIKKGEEITISAPHIVTVPTERETFAGSTKQSNRDILKI